MERMSGMLLDVSSSCRLDGIILDAANDAGRGPAPASTAKKILWRLGWSGESRDLGRVHSVIWTTIEGAAKRDRWNQRFGGQFAFLVEYLVYLFQPVASVIAVGRLSDHPVLSEVAQLALNGFLPVDVEGEGSHRRILLACHEGAAKSGQ